MRIQIVTDAWLPQVNGVVRTLQTVGHELAGLGHEVRYVTPQDFVTLPCPTYPEIRLSVLPMRRLRRMILDFQPSAIHIATEGPLGLAARRFCLRRGLPFTTSFHTRFPEYIRARFPIPESLSYAFVRRFHNAGQRTMVATEGLRDELAARGFTRLGLWGRGVDVELFRPQDKRQHDAPRPYFLYVGRIAVEKGLPDFLKLDLPGTKFVVGDGPALASLRQQYPDTRFVGAHQGEALARWYADADVFVFPSRTDTFGLVVLEALACGVPVVAYPVRGPLDVIGDAPVGVLDEDLGRAALAAQAIDPAACRAFALQRTWTHCARQFVDNLSPFDPAGEAVVASAA